MAARKPDAAFDAARAIEAAMVLRERYKEAFGDDQELIADSIEGETSLFEKLEVLVESIAEDEALADALKARGAAIAERRARIEKRAALKRALVLTAMQVAEIQRREFPVATLSITQKPDQVLVTEEADIPSRFFVTPNPILSKSLLNDAWKARKAALAEAAKIDDPAARTEALARVETEHPRIPGSELSNGGNSLTIRFK